MSIKRFLARLVEKITGRKCCRCRHNIGGRCCHPDGRMFMRCWHGITRPGFTTKNEGREPASGWAMDDSNMAPGDMSPEEKHQLAKIVEGLKEASETARDGGLLEG